MADKKKDFVIFGLGRFGKSIAQTLSQKGHDVLAIDKSADVIQEVSEYVTHAVQADVTDLDALRSLGIRNFDVAIVGIGTDMQSSIMATLLAKELGIDYVLAKAQNDVHKKVLEKIGADRVIFPEREMGAKIALNLISGNIVDYIELSSDYSIVEIAPLEEWIGKTIRDLSLRGRYGINIMAIRHGDNIDISPGPDYTLTEDDILIVIGHNSDLKKIDAGI